MLTVASFVLVLPLLLEKKMEIAQIYKQLNEEAQRQAQIGQKQKRRRQLATAARIGKTWVRK